MHEQIRESGVPIAPARARRNGRRCHETSWSQRWRMPRDHAYLRVAARQLPAMLVLGRRVVQDTTSKLQKARPTTPRTAQRQLKERPATDHLGLLGAGMLAGRLMRLKEVEGEGTTGKLAGDVAGLAKDLAGGVRRRWPAPRANGSGRSPRRSAEPRRVRPARPGSRRPVPRAKWFRRSPKRPSRCAKWQHLWSEWEGRQRSSRRRRRRAKDGTPDRRLERAAASGEWPLPPRQGREDGPRAAGSGSARGSEGRGGCARATGSGGGREGAGTRGPTARPRGAQDRRRDADWRDGKAEAGSEGRLSWRGDVPRAAPGPIAQAKGTPDGLMVLNVEREAPPKRPESCSGTRCFRWKEAAARRADTAGAALAGAHREGAARDGVARRRDPGNHHHHRRPLVSRRVPVLGDAAGWARSIRATESVFTVATGGASAVVLSGRTADPGPACCRSEPGPRDRGQAMRRSTPARPPPSLPRSRSPASSCLTKVELRPRRAAGPSFVGAAAGRCPKPSDRTFRPARREAPTRE